MTSKLLGLGPAALLAAIVWATPALAQVPPSNVDGDRSANGITQPSERLRLVFASPGIIRERLVRAGDDVTKDQPLLVQDDRIERERLTALEREAKSEARVEYARADLAVKQKVLERKRSANEENRNNGGSGAVFSQQEIEEAELNVQLGIAQVAVAELDHATKKAEAAQQVIKVELMQLRSPIDGTVELIDVGPGEMADPSKANGALVVVKNDPLWVEFHLPTRQALTLQKGQSLPVAYTGSQQAKPAKIIYVAPVADAASDMMLVRLEMPNPEDQKSGLQVQVTLPDKAVAAAR
ncbi:MAG TPA: efflux RND transporter periplasmic adaptor subunit [Tepidisphaeraceae bacterium]|nr:efflux RND transporter periplasmic adaptor subunit [Tepidisphaeraceae bacterium]